MPFDCGNITLSNANCNQLLKYCNNNYGTRELWCMCMVANTDYCNSEFSLLLLLLIIPASLFVMSFCILVFSNCYTKFKNRKKAGNNIIIITDRNVNGNILVGGRSLLEPIATNIRKNALGMQEPMKIPNEIVVDDVPQYEENNSVKPPEYDV